MDLAQTMRDFAPPPSAQPIQEFPRLAENEDDEYPLLQSLEDFDKQNPWQPKPKLVPAQSIKVNPEYSIKFNNLCVKHFIVPAFEFDMPAGVCHSVRVQFGDRTLQLEGPFANKKHAKEDICKQAWPQLLEMDEQLHKKRKVSQTQQVRSGSVSGEVLNSENFIGLLQGKRERTTLSPAHCFV